MTLRTHIVTENKCVPRRVRLQTSNGAFVHEQTIPPFNAAPDIIVWGLRLFRRTDLNEIDEHGVHVSVYSEGFAYALVPHDQSADVF